MFISHTGPRQRKTTLLSPANAAYWSTLAARCHQSSRTNDTPRPAPPTTANNTSNNVSPLTSGSSGHSLCHTTPSQSSSPVTDSSSTQVTILVNNLIYSQNFKKYAKIMSRRHTYTHQTMLWDRICMGGGPGHVMTQM